MFRATIALVVGFALVPRSSAAANPNATPTGDTAEESAPTGDADRASKAPHPGRRSVSQPAGQPFSDDHNDSGSAGAEVGEQNVNGDDAEPEEGTEGELGTSLRALSCLEGEGGNDNDGARRGVQKRDFMKRLRVEIAALGGYYASDALSSTYLYGGAVSFFPSEDFGVELLVVRNPVAFRLEEPFNSFSRELHFQSGVAWNVLGGALWSPVHAKLRWSEKRITHADLFLVAGAGQTLNGTVQGLTFQAGMGIKLYLARFVSLRLDVRDLMVPQEVLGRGRATHNLVMMFGICAWVPG